ncbi:MAG: FecR domain-containing protein [Proteobacteria bacterium]|nr:FecR domain-containing protein [Pseudomonadota bacterium]MCL2307048.1 FecR domain-containing protein [Pseudomonadota bacterium]
MTDLRFPAAFLLGLFALTLHAAEPAERRTDVIAGVADGVTAGVIEYTVQPGDSISSLSERYLDGRARWGAIAKLNPGLDIHKLRSGQKLYLPENRIRSVSKPARVLKINGQAQSDGINLQEGQQLAAGTVIDVDADSFVTLQLDDGSILVIEPNTRARLDELRQLSTGSQRSLIHIDHGRINAKPSPQTTPGARFEISTPSATTAVRGTHFRVGENEGKTTVTVIEVDKGRVLVATPEKSESVIVPAGNGSIVAAGQAPSTPKPLLPAPDLSALPEKHTQTILEIVFPPVANAAAYRVTVARDETFNDVVAVNENTLPQLKVANLPDGQYYLRARAVSAEGLHGLEAHNAFLLHARPEPPFASAPVLDKRLPTGAITLMWAAPENAVSYDILIARDEQPPLRIERHPEPSYTLEAVPGQYRWQLATRDIGDRLGPFGRQSAFTVIEPPSAPTAQALLPEGRDVVTLAWAGAPDQTYHWQLASDSDFSSIRQEGESEKPSIELPMLDAGAYFVRVRATTSDGIEGPYSSGQKFIVPEEESGFPAWILLFFLPLLAL